MPPWVGIGMVGAIVGEDGNELGEGERVGWPAWNASRGDEGIKT